MYSKTKGTLECVFFGLSAHFKVICRRDGVLKITLTSRNAELRSTALLPFSVVDVSDVIRSFFRMHRLGVVNFRDRRSHCFNIVLYFGHFGPRV